MHAGQDAAQRDAKQDMYWELDIQPASMSIQVVDRSNESTTLPAHDEPFDGPLKNDGTPDKRTMAHKKWVARQGLAPLPDFIHRPHTCEQLRMAIMRAWLGYHGGRVTVPRSAVRILRDGRPLQFRGTDIKTMLSDRPNMSTESGVAHPRRRYEMHSLQFLFHNN
jgi:hypothetical protein